MKEKLYVIGDREFRVTQQGGRYLLEITEEDGYVYKFRFSSLELLYEEILSYCEEKIW